MGLFSLFSQSLAKEKYIFFDVETTGLFPLCGDKILEIAMIKVDGGEIVDKFESMFNPQIKISEEITNINGITNEMVKDSPVFSKDIGNDIIKFIEDTTLVAHNAAFDLGFLSTEMARVGITFDGWRSIDSLKIATSIFPGQKNKLESLMKRYNIEQKGDLHRAYNDTIILKDVFFQLLDETEIRGKTFDNILNKYGFKGIILPRSVPFTIKEAMIEKRAIFGKYKKRNGEIIEINFKPIAPVWVEKRWFIFGEDTDEKKFVTISGDNWLS
ncbi:MAG TPA: 3'-5' exonuclease [Spirochaetota bacterium]|nr:3'-5' exonuclease [Spirochaetota bacterium]